jgi:succinoglycan biosynthesis protein ExoO
MSDGSSPRERISVILPTFNSVLTVDRAIDSVLAQTWPDWQLILVDDASTDATVEKLQARRRGHEDRIVVVRCPLNGGPSAARNRGIEACDGAWIALLDADDAWRADRLEVLLAASGHAQADAVCDNLLGFDDHYGKETGPLFSQLPARLDIPQAVAATWAGTYNLGYLKPVIRRDFVTAHGLRYDENLRTGEDLLFLVNLLVHGANIVCVDTPSYIYTTAVGAASRRVSQSTNSAPRDEDMAHALAELEAGARARLTEAERAAIDARIAHLRYIAPVAKFRHARLQRRWGEAVSLLLASPAVRARLWEVLREKTGLRR